MTDQTDQFRTTLEGLKLLFVAIYKYPMLTIYNYKYRLKEESKPEQKHHQVQLSQLTQYKRYIFIDPNTTHYHIDGSKSDTEHKLILETFHG